MRGLGLALASALAGTAVLLPASAAQAAPVSSCTPSAGTVVAVDFAHWNGPVVRGCDTAEPQTGAELLTDSGFVLSGTQHDGPAFICRIGNSAYERGRQYPTVQQDPCVLTPPATAYWSYWVAASGSNQWTYSNWGAYAEQSKPRPGGVQLWIFGGTRTSGSKATPVDGFPVCSPRSLRAGGSPTRCTPRSATTTRRHREHPTASASARAPVPSPRSPSMSRTRTPTPRATSRRAGPPSTASSASSTRPVLRTTAPGSGSAAVVDARPATTTQPSSGSAVPLLVTLARVTLLLGGGGAAVWRRRRGEPR